MKKKNEELSFKDLISIFIPKLWIIAIVSVLCSAVLGLYSGLVKKDTYTASSLMYVYKSSASINFNDAQIAETMVDIYRYRLYSEDMLTQIVNALPAEYEGNVDRATVRSAISFSNQKNGMFRISVTTSDPKLSFDLKQCIENIAPPEFIEINSQLGIEIMDSTARVPKAPDSKNVPENAVIGFVAGAFISALAIWIFSAFDTTIDSKKKIEDSFDIPVLGVIPEHMVQERKEAANQNV
ncbi:MAG: hypothetical protein J6V09_00340 [Clostridia bacterium]|nr:hypothetical protein [Clostridia bacterium]